MPVDWHSTVVLYDVIQYSCDTLHGVCAIVWHSTVVLYVRQHSSEPLTLSLDLLWPAIELAPPECLTKVSPSN